MRAPCHLRTMSSMFILLNFASPSSCTSRKLVLAQKKKNMGLSVDGTLLKVMIE